MTNPKTLVFFMAFLPQFIDRSAGHAGLQLATLGVVFGVMACCSDSLWALAAGGRATGSAAGPSGSTASASPVAP